MVLLFFDLKNRLFSAGIHEGPIYPYVLKCVLSFIAVAIVGFLISEYETGRSELKQD
ncbi:hypothetical protein KOR42_55550 [Thalassoglobus neptunius]|uniref:Uncharacterized protein n=1 Tax=Thalassoglobus neptunius TaxID=1938619 RepID=A0A5C5URR5_9PLAN|nr:hypothetical protein KOR42_55550 [Thalassoglobus neptunius]